MKLAIMQPYFFPYLGYFQLIASVDLFVLYNDVAFRKNAWINRNRLLVNGEPIYFTVPLEKASSFRAINKTPVHHGLYLAWRQKFFRTLELNYGKAPNFSGVFDLVHSVLDEEFEDIASLAYRSVTCCCRYLGISTTLCRSSESYPNAELRGFERILDICRKSGADTYVNAPGGRSLYQREQFEEHGIRLAFLRPRLSPYAQRGGTFVSGLSILDVLMNCDLNRMKAILVESSIE